MGGPCEWGLSYAECSDTAALDSLSDEDKANVEAMAVEYLWRWTRQQFGLCDVSIRPCRAGCLSGQSTFWGNTASAQTLGPGIAYAAELVQIAPGEFTVKNSAVRVAQWSDFTCGACGPSGCDCGDYARSFMLPGPITSVTGVVIDGEVLDPSAYRVDNRRVLVRTDGGAWPTCQTMHLPVTEVGTWEVTYAQGTAVPQGGKIAAGMLAAEFAKALCNDSTCRLPQRVQSITRQGVTMAVLDSFEDLEKGRTGIWLIDSWVASVMGTEAPSRVYSVDIPRPRNRRTTWPSLPSP